MIEFVRCEAGPEECAYVRNAAAVQLVHAPAGQPPAAMRLKLFFLHLHARACAVVHALPRWLD